MNVGFTEQQSSRSCEKTTSVGSPRCGNAHDQRARGISVWRRGSGEIWPADVERLREVEAENATLKRMVAEHSGGGQ